MLCVCRRAVWSRAGRMCWVCSTTQRYSTRNRPSTKSSHWLATSPLHSLSTPVHSRFNRLRAWTPTSTLAATLTFPCTVHWWAMRQGWGRMGHSLQTDVSMGPSGWHRVSELLSVYVKGRIVVAMSNALLDNFIHCYICCIISHIVYLLPCNEVHSLGL